MGKLSTWKVADIFFYFSQKIGFDISCKLDLHEMSNPIFWENKKKDFEMSSADFFTSMLNVKKVLVKMVNSVEIFYLAC